jgi:hypothetical protein
VKLAWQVAEKAEMSLALHEGKNRRRLTPIDNNWRIRVHSRSFAADDCVKVKIDP